MSAKMYNCTRCGNPTYILPENPYGENHVLGRFCANCLPVLFQGLREGKPEMQIIIEAAQHIKIMNEMEQIVPQDFHVE